MGNQIFTLYSVEKVDSQGAGLYLRFEKFLNIVQDASLSDE